jgi:Ca2+-binding RTX toxin-like protein
VKRIVRVLALGALLLALAAGAPLAQQMFNEIQCDGGSCEGTDGRDQITGTDEQDQILAKDGSDQVDARARDDEVRGARGRDVLFGDSPERGADTRRDGDDELNGGRGSDFLVGFGGSDLLVGGRGPDGIDANDDSSQNPGEDTVRGGSGDDRIFAQDGFEDTIDCGEDFDTVFFDVGIDTVVNCEVENPEVGPGGPFSAQEAPVVDPSTYEGRGL